MATTAYNFPTTFNNNNFHMNQSAGPSPPDAYQYATPPSTNSSPTSLHSSAHVNVRQLRQPRQPMYIPAALRPTDPLAKPTDIPNRPRAPDTPPASNESSFNSGKAGSPTLELGGMPSEGQLEGSEINLLRRGLSFATSDMSDDTEDVTGHPTTAHWKPDASASHCAVCHQTFTWFFRRHHCRRCGDLVCDFHIRQRVPLDQNARLHPNGMDSKACDPCAEEWQVVQRLRRSRTSSIADSQNSSQGTAVPSLAIPKLHRQVEDMRVGSMARSEGMSWSTF